MVMEMTDLMFKCETHGIKSVSFGMVFALSIADINCDN